ncbi:hypothetical protein CXB51_031327 [Gossypium anomalum]|uniref:Uncharacterized protein n=1 Tax=Gossypium anomalum TaxID=47600 RepID=A0A8J5XQY2_9ROSI|nr:hypothetical protein CXB51_031327 [Gossypium anomalum]
MLVKVLLLLSSVLRMKLLFAVPVMKRSTCAINLLADMSGLVWQIPVMFLAVTYVKMHLIDGSSLCLQCDMIVHVGGKRTHGRNLLLRQRVEFPGDKPAHIDETRRGQNHPPKTPVGEKQQNHKVSPVHGADAAAAAVGHLETDSKMIDLNMKPHRIHGQASNNQEDGPNNQTLMQVMYGKHYRCGIPISAYRWAKKLIRRRRSRWSTDDEKW